MFNLKTRYLIILATAALFFSQNALAAPAMSSHGASSYSHGEKKGEGSKTKTMSHRKSGSGHYSGHKGHTRCPFTHLLNMKDELSLTEAQVAEIKKLRFEYQKKSIRNKADHKIAHLEFDMQVHAEKLDADAIRLAAGKIAKTKTDKVMAKADAKIALLSLLTEGQRKKAHAMYSASH